MGSMMRQLVVAAVLAIGLADHARVAMAANEQSAPPPFGTALRPFAADSPWNSRPVDPVLSEVGIPAVRYVPAVVATGWSTGVFTARAGDPENVVRGSSPSQGVWHPDSLRKEPVRIARWPLSVLPASESDGHADIVDAQERIVHSFWQLKREKQRWTATQYAWTRLDGRGWGDPAHPFQGSRAAGVPTMAGLIRKWEVNDGEPTYRHALAMSLAGDALSREPSYVYPATSADRDADTTYKGKIPMGALLMLPKDFDLKTVRDKRVRKIAATLQQYGGYVVDRNDGTPFVIYAEAGSGLDLPGDPWNAVAAEDLERIRKALRMVEGARGWVDGHGRPTPRIPDMNLLSLRGPWHVEESDRKAGVRYDPRTQTLHFSGKAKKVSAHTHLPEGLTEISWAQAVPGAPYRLVARTTGGARLRMVLLRSDSDGPIADSGRLGDGGSFTFVWPKGGAKVKVEAIAGPSKHSSVAGELRRHTGAERTFIESADASNHVKPTPATKP